MTPESTAGTLGERAQDVDVATLAPSAKADLPPSTKQILKLLHKKMFYEVKDDALSAFLDQIESGTQPTVVTRLLQEAKDEKAALAQLYVDRLEELLRDPQFGVWATPIHGREAKDLELDVFIESGSTLLYVSYELYQALGSSPRREAIFENVHRLSLRTNNNLTAWLYLNPEEKRTTNHGDGSPDKAQPQEDVGGRITGPDGDPITPFLISGYLENKYHGVFPFHPRDAEPVKRKNPRTMDRLILQEQAGYAQCRADLSRCNLLLLATSRLSLLHGPTVGSRQNAIFKNATYNACVPNLDETPSHAIHLFITARKLLAHDEKNCEFLKTDPWIQDSHERFFSIKDERERLNSRQCFPAFDIVDANKPRIVSPFSSSLCQASSVQPLKDGTLAVSIGDRRFRTCSTWMELFAKARLSLDVFVSYKTQYLPECAKQRAQRGQVEGGAAQGGWLDAMELMPPGDCERERKCLCQECWIRREVQFARDHAVRGNGQPAVTYDFSIPRCLGSDKYQMGRIRIGPLRREAERG